jgi:hypothetical protein
MRSVPEVHHKQLVRRDLMSPIGINQPQIVEMTADLLREHRNRSQSGAIQTTASIQGEKTFSPSSPKTVSPSSFS